MILLIHPLDLRLKNTIALEGSMNMDATISEAGSDVVSVGAKLGSKDVFDGVLQSVLVRQHGFDSDRPRWHGAHIVYYRLRWVHFDYLSKFFFFLFFLPG